MATLTVNSLLDNTTAGDGLVTLREAIAAANDSTTTDLNQTGTAGHDDIVFAPGLNGSILLGGSHILIWQDLTITGRGAANTIIDAQQNSRIFLVVTAVGSVDLTLDSLKLTRGQSTLHGGAIRFATTDGGLLTVRNSTFSGNSAIGDDHPGGAIYMTQNADVVIENCLFTGNYTTGSKSPGGAIAVPNAPSLTGSDITVTGSTFTGNHTSGASSDGGAISTGDDFLVTIRNSIFHNN
ncbi:MAG: right-handed parallel beta-helix repeat-containing protein, partial [Planctomycetaceae bacterium]|nr:right-handed parallel beta-helix repeat-containing protein [Planctomycetaceae bacterium]